MKKSILVISIAILILLLSFFRQMIPADEEASRPNARPNQIENDGKIYIACQSHALQKLPEGFVHTGNATLANGVSAQIYFNQDYPQIRYLQIESVIVNQEGVPYIIYEKLIDRKLYGRRILCRDGEYYISIQTAEFAGPSADFPENETQSIKEKYPDRFTSLPSGFTRIGCAEYCGSDRIPIGQLSCNMKETDVYASSEQPELLLTPFEWTITPAPGAPAQKHQGFEVFLHYDGPFD